MEAHLRVITQLKKKRKKIEIDGLRLYHMDDNLQPLGCPCHYVNSVDEIMSYGVISLVNIFLKIYLFIP